MITKNAQQSLTKNRHRWPDLDPFLVGEIHTILTAVDYNEAYFN